MTFKMNDPVWILGTEPGFFERYMDVRHPHIGIHVGVAANGVGFGALVPSHWITEREVNG